MHGEQTSVNELYKLLKQAARSQEKHSPVICGFAVMATDPLPIKQNASAWLRQIADDIDAGVDAALMFSIDGVHLEEQGGTVDVPEVFDIFFIDMALPPTMPTTEHRLPSADPGVN